MSDTDASRESPDPGSTEDEPSRRDATPVLEIDSLQKDFGGVIALDGVSLTVNEGEIVGLIGPNGAGKTTLFNCITGVHTPDGGAVVLRDRDITGMTPHKVVQQGLSRTFQIARVFPELTVRENMIANQAHRDEGIMGSILSGTSDDTEARIEELVDFLSLSHLIDEPAGDLSTGQKKLLNLAGALLREPDIVLLDEPVAGVNPRLVDDIIESILELNERGRTFFVIEHDIEAIQELSDHLYAISNGQNLAEGHPDEVLTKDSVLEAYFGQ